jgi:epoxyqueuosine reductase
MGNRRDPRYVPALAEDEEPLVRCHAAWALGRIGGAEARRRLAEALDGEYDPAIREAIEAALGAMPTPATPSATPEVEAAPPPDASASR